MEDEEVSNDNIEPKYDRTFHTGMIVKIAENTLKTATGIDIPDDWYTLLFSVNTVYDDSVLIINTELNICARMYKDTLDIMEVIADD